MATQLLKTKTADGHPIRGTDAADTFDVIGEHSFSQFPQVTVQEPEGGINATTKMLVVVTCYSQNSSQSRAANYNGYTVHLDSVSAKFADSVQAIKTGDGNGSLHWVISTFKAVTIDSCNDLELDCVGTVDQDNWFWFWFWVENTDQADPIIDVASMAATDAGPRTLSGIDATADEAQVLCWVHNLISARTMTTDADWTEAINRNAAVILADIGVSYNVPAGAGETAFTITGETNSSFITHAIAITMRSASAGVVFSNVNGDNTVSPDQQAPDNTAKGNGSGLTGATGITMDGVSQPDFAVIDDTQVEWSVDMDGSPDLAYGLVSFVLAHPGGNQTVNSVLLGPPDDYDFVTVTSASPPASQRSVFRVFTDPDICSLFGMANVAIAVGDDVEWETLGGTVVVDANNGTWTYSGPAGPYAFLVRALRLNDAGGQWTPYIPIVVNAKAIVTTVDGATNTTGSVDFDATNSEIVGENFTDVEGEVWIQPFYGDLRDEELDEGVAVQQPAASSWTNTKIVLPSWERGALPGGIKHNVMVVPGGD